MSHDSPIIVPLLTLELYNRMANVTRALVVCYGHPFVLMVPLPRPLDQFSPDDEFLPAPVLVDFYILDALENVEVLLRALTVNPKSLPDFL